MPNLHHIIHKLILLPLLCLTLSTIPNLLAKQKNKPSKKTTITQKIKTKKYHTNEKKNILLLSTLHCTLPIIITLIYNSTHNTHKPITENTTHTDTTTIQDVLDTFIREFELNKAIQRIQLWKLNASSELIKHLKQKKFLPKYRQITSKLNSLNNLSADNISTLYDYLNKKQDPTYKQYLQDNIYLREKEFLQGDNYKPYDLYLRQELEQLKDLKKEKIHNELNKLIDLGEIYLTTDNLESLTNKNLDLLELQEIINLRHEANQAIKSLSIQEIKNLNNQQLNQELNEIERQTETELKQLCIQKEQYLQYLQYFQEENRTTFQEQHQKPDQYNKYLQYLQDNDLFIEYQDYIQQQNNNNQDTRYLHYLQNQQLQQYNTYTSYLQYKNNLKARQKQKDLQYKQHLTQAISIVATRILKSQHGSPLLNKQYAQGNTPLHLLIQATDPYNPLYIPHIQVLLLLGANPTLTNNAQQTPIQLIKSPTYIDSNNTPHTLNIIQTNPINNQDNNTKPQWKATWQQANNNI